MDNQFLNLLHEEHEAVNNIFRDFDITPHERIEVLGDRWYSFKRLILPHMVAEENTFYPVLHGKSESRDDVLRSLEEHHAVEAQLAEVNNMPLTIPDEWFNRFNRLREMVLQHVQFEETTIFQDTLKVLSNGEIQAVMDKYKEAENRARESMTVQGFVREGPQ